MVLVTARLRIPLSRRRKATRLVFRRLAGLSFFLLALPGSAVAGEQVRSDPPAAAVSLERVAADVSADLQRALSESDAAEVERLMAPDVRIFESGNVESSFEEYASHHMHSDMAFMSAMQSQVLDRRVIGAEGMAVVLTRYRITGQWKGKALALVNTETLVLQPLDGEWKIAHIHWSSN